MTRNRWMSLVRVTALCAAITAIAPTAWAQTAGIQGGISRNPDQFYAGLQAESSPIRRLVTFRPAIQAGLGDGLATLTGHLDFVVRPDQGGSVWTVFIGGGPSANLYWWREGPIRDRDFGVGGTLLIGIEHERQRFVELRIGLGRGPHIKLGIGFTFGQS